MYGSLVTRGKFPVHSNIFDVQMIQRLNTGIPDKWVSRTEVQISGYMVFMEISFQIEILPPGKADIIAYLVPFPLICTAGNYPHPAEYGMMICIELLAGIKF
jgi:hypothetical protein